MSWWICGERTRYPRILLWNEQMVQAPSPPLTNEGASFKGKGAFWEVWRDIERGGKEKYTLLSTSYHRSQLSQEDGSFFSTMEPLLLHQRTIPTVLIQWLTSPEKAWKGTLGGVSILLRGRYTKQRRVPAKGGAMRWRHRRWGTSFSLCRGSFPWVFSKS